MYGSSNLAHLKQAKGSQLYIFGGKNQQITKLTRGSTGFKHWSVIFHVLKPHLQKNKQKVSYFHPK